MHTQVFLYAFSFRNLGLNEKSVVCKSQGLNYDEIIIHVPGAEKQFSFTSEGREITTASVKIVKIPLGVPCD